MVMQMRSTLLRINFRRGYIYSGILSDKLILFEINHGVHSMHHNSNLREHIYDWYIFVGSQSRITGLCQEGMEEIT